MEGERGQYESTVNNQLKAWQIKFRIISLFPEILSNFIFIRPFIEYSMLD